MGRREKMKTDIAERIFHLTKYVLLFFLIFFQSYAFASDIRLEGKDFKENLLGLWEGNWTWVGQSGKEHIKIIKIDENKLHLTGFSEGGNYPDTDEVSGRIENSILLLSWPAASGSGCKEEYTMKRDDANNLILDGHFKCGDIEGEVKLKKIE
jgi:hypothetical protein